MIEITKKPECWSADAEDFNCQTLQDLIDINSELKAGDMVYAGEAVHPRADQLCNVDSVLEDISQQAWDIAGEYAEDYPDVTPEARLELENLLTTWITKHAAPTFYTVTNVREYVLTDEDMEAA